MQAVVFAAGKSTRTYPLTLTRPKPLLPVMNKPVLAHQLDALAGIADHVYLVVGYKREMIEARFGARYNGIRIEYVHQEEQKGTGHALLQCAGRVDGPFLAMNGDDLFAAEDLRAAAELEQGALGQEIADPRVFAVFDVDAAMNLVRIVEKPRESGPALANVGVYKFTPEIFDILSKTPPSDRGEIELPSAIQTLCEWRPFRVLKAQGAWFPIGYPWDLLAANEHYLEHHLTPSNSAKVSPLAQIEGPVSIGEGTVIHPGAFIQGPVCIGDHCAIGPNCWVRPATAIGNGCKVGQGVEIKNSILMDGARVPHLSYVGDSIIGEAANLGCGTVTANFRHDGGTHRSLVKGQLVDTGRRKLGAIIGDHVHTGINTSIYPGRKLWPHTFTRPGAVVDRDIEG